MYTIQFDRKQRYNSTVHITINKDTRGIVRYTTNGGHLLEIIETTLKGKEPRIEFNYQTGEAIIHMTPDQYEIILAMIYAAQMKKYDLIKSYYTKPSPSIIQQISVLAIARRLFTLESMYLLSLIKHEGVDYFSISCAPEQLRREAWRLWDFQNRIVTTLIYGRAPIESEIIIGYDVTATFELKQAEWEFLHELFGADDKNEILYKIDSIMKKLGHEKEWIAVNIMTLESMYILSLVRMHETNQDFFYYSFELTSRRNRNKDIYNYTGVGKLVVDALILSKEKMSHHILEEFYEISHKEYLFLHRLHKNDSIFVPSNPSIIEKSMKKLGLEKEWLVVNVMSLEFMYELTLFHMIGTFDPTYYSFKKSRMRGTNPNVYRFEGIGFLIINAILLSKNRSPAINNKYELTEKEYFALCTLHLETAEWTLSNPKEIDKVVRDLNIEKEWLAVSIMSLESNEHSPTAARATN